jgi:hypothetical protein
MTGRVIVMVCDLDDSSHGEINVMDSHDLAARFVESLLESGFDQGRVRVFSGDELNIQVRHRPVVQISTPDPTQNGSGRKEEEQPEATSDRRQVGDQPVARIALAEAPVASSLAFQEVAAAEPFVQNGMRFSTMFRPA